MQAQDAQDNRRILTVSPAVPMARSIPTLAAGSMTLGSLIMPGKATDRTTHVLISACKQLSMRRAAHSYIGAVGLCSQDKAQHASSRVGSLENHVCSELR